MNKTKIKMIVGAVLSFWGCYGACTFANSIVRGLIPLIIFAVGFVTLLLGIGEQIAEHEGKETDENVEIMRVNLGENSISMMSKEDVDELRNYIQDFIKRKAKDNE